MEGGHVVQEDGRRFAAPLGASLEVGFCFGERAEVEVGPAAIEAHQPGIREPPSFLELRHCFASLSLFEQRFPFDQFSVVLRLCLELRSEM